VPQPPRDPAHDDEPGSIRRPGRAPPGPVEPARRWYGTPILVTDGVSYALLATAITHERTAPYVLPLSLAGYGLGGPIVHGAHGRWGAAGRAGPPRRVPTTFS